MRCVFFFSFCVTLGILSGPLASQSGASAPLSPGEVVLLFSVGATPAQVDEVVARRGLEGTATPDELARAEAAGAGKALLDRLARADATLLHLRELAQQFTGIVEPSLGLALLAPPRWTSSTTALRGGASLIQLSPDSGGRPWIEVPTLFVYCFPNSDLTRSPIAGSAVAQCLARKIGAEMSDVQQTREKALLGERTVPEWRAPLRSTAGSEIAEVRFRVRVDEDGYVLVVGLARPLPGPAADAAWLERIAPHVSRIPKERTEGRVEPAGPDRSGR